MLKGRLDQVAVESSAAEEEAEIIQAFGTYWRPAEVQWQGKRLLGKHKGATETVDHWNQRGVYLLHDGGHIVHVGRATDQAIGKRINDHQYDRLSGRWERFSWFGFCPIDEKGRVGDLPGEKLTVSAEQLISLVESLLIETQEPLLNRRRGDEVSDDLEYTQVVDPEILQRQYTDVLNRLTEMVKRQ